VGFRRGEGPHRIRDGDLAHQHVVVDVGEIDPALSKRPTRLFNAALSRSSLAPSASAAMRAMVRKARMSESFIGGSRMWWAEARLIVLIQSARRQKCQLACGCGPLGGARRAQSQCGATHSKTMVVAPRAASMCSPYPGKRGEPSFRTGVVVYNDGMSAKEPSAALTFIAMAWAESCAIACAARRS
jgi:hypothetical protein